MKNGPIKLAQRTNRLNIEDISNLIVGMHQGNQRLLCNGRQLPLQVLLATFDTNAAVDLRADLTSIDVPALVIQGDADKNNPLELTGRRAAGLMPQARLVILAGAGHGLYRSEARRYTTEIISFAHALAQGAVQFS